MRDKAMRVAKAMDEADEEQMMSSYTGIGESAQSNFRELLAREIAKEDAMGRQFVPGWKSIPSWDKPREAEDFEEEVRQLRLVNTQLETKTKHLTVDLRNERRENKRLRKKERNLITSLQKLSESLHLNATDSHLLEIMLDELLTETETVQV